MTTTVRVQAAAAAVALLLLATLVTRASTAAFVGQVANDGNYFQLGSLMLEADPVTALFEVSNMLPGETQTRCIEVTYSGTPNAGTVKVYTGGFTDPGGIAQYLDITISEGSTTDTTNGACTGWAAAGTPIRATTTLAAFLTQNGSYANGVGTWMPDAEDLVRSYQVAVQLKASTPETAEGKRLEAFNLTWRVETGA
jgi:hypothetical protein